MGWGTPYLCVCRLWTYNYDRRILSDYRALNYMIVKVLHYLIMIQTSHQPSLELVLDKRTVGFSISSPILLPNFQCRLLQRRRKKRLIAFTNNLDRRPRACTIQARHGLHVPYSQNICEHRLGAAQSSLHPCFYRERADIHPHPCEQRGK